MKKSELIKEISTRSDISTKETEKIFDEVFNVIKDVIKNEGEINIKDFGSFKVADVKEQMRLNPATKEKFLSPASKKLKFKISKTLKEDLNK